MLIVGEFAMQAESSSLKPLNAKVLLRILYNLYSEFRLKVL